MKDIAPGFTWKSFVLGTQHACAIDSANHLFCWGDNTFGQLGQAPSAPATTPQQIDDRFWVSVSLGDGFTCATTQSQLFCWGDNSLGQLGLGDTAPRSSPVELLPPSGTSWTQVVAGARHACALTPSQQLSCWGDNGRRQVGVSDLNPKLTPQSISGTWSEVGLGDEHTCAVRADQSVVCWGSNTYGAADPSVNARRGTAYVNSNPVLNASVVDRHLAVGARHNCVSDTESLGDTVCWGDNTFGQLGAGDFAEHLGLVTWPQRSTKVVLGDRHGCSLQVVDPGSPSIHNEIRCWGGRQHGQLNDGRLPIATTPQAIVTPGMTWSGMSAQDQSICARRDNGQLLCWGDNTSGQLGNNSFSPRAQPTQAGVSGKWKKVSRINSFACAIDSEDLLYCWGQDEFATGTGVLGTLGFPTRVGLPQQRWSDVSISFWGSCAITRTGELYCWGLTFDGLLPLDDGSYLRPTRIGTGTTWRQVSLRESGGCATTTDDRLACWGANPGVSSNPAPQAVTFLPGTTWKQVSVGDGFACATTIYDFLKCWGVGPGINSETPVDVPKRAGSAGWDHVSAASGHLCAATTSPGLPYCWGDNASGQLGVGDFETVNAPQYLQSLATTGSGSFLMTAYTSSTCTLIDTMLYCWGATTNSYHAFPYNTGRSVTWASLGIGDDPSGITSDGALHYWSPGQEDATGYGMTGLRGSVTDQSGPLRWLDVSPSAETTCAIGVYSGTSGKLFCWGESDTSVLGSTTTQSAVPLAIGTATNWTRVATTSGHACAINTQNKLFCWGDNTYGQLGIGNTAAKSTPTAVAGSQDYAAVAVSPDRSCALTTQNKLQCWGRPFVDVIDLLPSTDFGGAYTYTAFALARDFACGVTSEATYCWGDNVYGQLGNGTTASSPIPTAVGLTTSTVALATGAHHACALDSAGQLSCWGSNEFGQLGDGTTQDRHEPVRITSAGPWLAVTAGADFTCAVHTSGDLYCWGNRAQGQVGDGTFGGSATPVTVNFNGTAP